MYKILIVDDEIFVRMGLKMSIDWASRGFELLGEASNGQEALEKISETPPDIVITDIKMPVMDGIGLIKEISSSYPAIKCLVLSNYDEFELVKEAMKLGAVDYFLKVTIESDKLLEALEQVCEKLDGERTAADRRRAIDQTIREHRTVIERKYYLDLVGHDGTPESLKATIDALGLKLYDMRGVILLLLLRDYRELLEGRFQSDRRLLEFTILNVVDELINHQSGGKIVEHSPGAYAMIVSWREPPDGNRVADLAERVRRALRDYLSIEANVVCGAPFAGHGSLQEALASLDKLKLEAFYEQEGGVLRQGQAVFPDGAIAEAYRAAKSRLKLFVGLGDGARAAACLEAFVDETRERRIDPLLAKRHVAALAGALQDGLAVKLGDKEGTPIDTAIAVRLEEAEDFAELKRTALGFARQGERLLESHAGQQSPRDEIVKVIAYVKEHYRQRVSLEEMARRVAMNKSYFSRLFKQETGEAFQDFLIRTRMEQAREQLLATDKKVADIATDVGYNDIFYFTRAFKQYYRMSPGEYKKNHREIPSE